MPTIDENYRALYTDFNGYDWALTLSDTFQEDVEVSPDREFELRDGGVQIDWAGAEDDLFDPIKSSTARAGLRIDDATDLSKITNIYTTGNEDNWYAQVWKFDPALGGQWDGNTGTWVLKWWGYLNPSDLQRENYSEPYIEVVASDVLALIQGLKFWERTYPVKYTTQNGDLIKAMVYKFGQLRAGPFVPAGNTVPINLFHNPEPYVHNVIHSLIFDNDFSGVPQAFQLMRFIDAYTQPLYVSGQTIFSTMTMQINEALYHDFPDQIYKGFPVVRNEDATVYDVLENICELFRARIIQKDGVYHFIQVEAFAQGTTLAYDEYRGQGGINGGTVRTAYSTLSTTDYQTDISSPQSDPYVEADGVFRILHPLGQAHLYGKCFNGQNCSYKHGVTAGINALSSHHRKEVQHNMLFDRDRFRFPIAGPTKTVECFRPGGTTAYELYNLCIQQTVEARNGVRNKYEGGIFSNTNESLIHTIVYDTQTYLMDRLSWNTEEGDWNGSWTQLAFSADNLQEPEGQFTPEEAQNFLYQWHLLWFNFFRQQGGG